MECDMALLCYIFRAWRAHGWNTRWHYFVIFSKHGTRSGVFVLYFYACGTRTGVILIYFPPVERTLVFCVKIISCCYILDL